MYLIDFFKRTFRKSNIAVIIYLVMNVILISLVTIAFFGPEMEYSLGTTWAIVLSALIGVVLYILSLAIALSPIGEWYVRFQNNCRELKDQQEIDYLMPIFNEVYAKARQKDPSISDQVKIFISDDPCPNAFATGRKTVCVTRGLMNMPADQIRATLGHEFGHLAHKDTDLLLAVHVGNLIVNAIITVIKVSIEVSRIFLSIFTLFLGGDEGWLAAVIGHLYMAAIAVTVNILSYIWSWIGTMLCMKSSRGNEFEADAFSTELGYGPALIDLMHVVGGEKPKGIFATLAASHPPKDERIANIQNVMNTMRQNPMIQGASQPAIGTRNGQVIPMPVNTGANQGAGRTTASRNPQQGQQRGNGYQQPQQGQQRGNGYQQVPQGGNGYGYQQQMPQENGYGTPQPVPAGAAAFSGGAYGAQQNRRPAQQAAPQNAAGYVRPKFCTNCGKKIEEGARYCIGCGNKLF